MNGTPLAYKDRQSGCGGFVARILSPTLLLLLL